MGVHRKPAWVAAALCVLLVAGSAFATDVTVRRVDQPVTQVFPQGQHYPPYDPDDGTTKVSAETAFGVTADLPQGEGSGPDITAPGAAVVPTIDGVVNAGEWADALAIDITLVASPVTMYLKHDGAFLYVAFVDENNTAIDAEEIGLYFDDEGGTPPILYDDIWTATDCPADEGNFWLGDFSPDPNDWFRGWIAGPTTCPVQMGGTNVNFAFSLSGGFIHYEAAVDLAASPLQAGQGETFGWRVYTFDNGVFTGRFPAASIFDDPSTYSNLTLGLLEEAVVCNGPTVQFEDGIPSTWTNLDNGGPFAWTTTADAATTPNGTGGSGEAATADSDAFNGAGDPYDAELWTNPFDLSAATAASMNYLYNFNSLDTGDFFDIDITTNGGGAWTNLVSYADDSSGPGVLDLSAYAGLSDVQLRFRYYGDSWDWYAQVDELALSCSLPSITMTKTVGTEPGVCAATDTIVVPPGTDVYYCYNVTNTGNVTLSLHDLVDDQLGTILDDFPFDLVPGASAQAITAAVNITTTTVNVATWTAFNPDPVEADESESTDSATVVVLENDTCDNAIELTCPQGGGTFSVQGSTLLASFTGPFDCADTHTAPEVWYRIMGNGGGIEATTCNQNTFYDTKLTAFDGTCGALGCVVSNDDDCADPFLSSTINWTSAPGVEYYIMVHGYSSGVGDFELTITCDIPVELQSITVE